MNKINNNQFSNIAKLGHFTKNAVKDFEKNIVSQKDYLEKVKNEFK
ncbi:MULTISPECIES: hypothetical protein [Clostridium]|nr:hypothetical protein [Clostridium botulinum]ACD52086.1 conserved hypothetical protein [Clostridium botulinum E3 str. Alaska E43]KAI3347274.1 hypothetical protein CIT18_12745 [Clostridium botulinum]MBY6789142.1 hypothetical protein [Clostridium botulinum]MBY6811919.1 hypothetical protein [Clostridium botulinum]MBY6816896.1 hypothetical protein [Clostridium botulinum]